jgi:hypothetical protein
VPDLSFAFTTFVNHPGSPSTPGAADINRLQDNDSFLGRKPIVSLTRNVDQTIPHSTVTDIAYNASAADPNGMHEVGSSKVICTVAGWYWIRAQVAWNLPASGTAGGFRSVRIFRDGVQFGRDDRNPVTSIGTYQSAEAFVDLAVGSVVTVGVAHGQGSSLLISGGTRGETGLAMKWERTL